MSRFTLSNQIFNLGLDSKEISVYAYMCSLPSLQNTLSGAATVRVKQATIALKCGIKAVQTVAKIISRLAAKGLVEPLERSIKANREKGTYRYAVKHLSKEKGYFFVDRFAFSHLNPRQIMIYLFICKSYSIQLHDCWNSYNDISEQTGMKRETVIQTIKELVELKFVVRMVRKSRENRRVYVDNHYQVIVYVRGNFNKKRRVRSNLLSNRTKNLIKLKSQVYGNTFKCICQGISESFFVSRGSP